MSWLDDAWGSLFGSSSPGAVGSSVYGPPGSAAPSQLGGLLDPRGIREQAFYQGLGSLGQGLLAAGLPHPATQGSLIPQALGAFQPAYSGALSQGYQQAAAEQQIRQQQQDDQAIAAYRQANPAAANMTRAAVVAQMSRQPPQNFELDPTRPGGVRPIQGGPADLSYAEALARAQRDPNMSVTEGGAIIDRNTGRIIASRPPAPHYVTDPNTGVTSVIQAPAPTVGSALAQPPSGGLQGQQPPSAPQPAPQPGQAAASSAPLGVQHNNPLNLGGEDAIRRGQWTYATPEEGTAAAVRQITLNASRNPNGTLTPLQLVQSWATTATPANQQSYAREISLATNTPIDQPLNLRDPAVMARVVTRMAQVEQGSLPGGYSDAITRGVQQGFQPGPIRPGSQRMYGGAGGAGPRAQPAMPGAQAAATPTAAAAPPPAAGGQGLPPGYTVTQVTPATGAAPFGPSEVSRAYGILIDPHSDPNSPLYAAAWNIVSRGTPAMQQDTSPGATPGSMVPVIIQPDMRSFRQPGGSAAGAAPPPASGTAPAPPPAGGAPAPPAAGSAPPPAAPSRPGTPQPVQTGPAHQPAPTTEQSRFADFATRMETAQDTIARLEARGYRPGAWDLALMRTGDLGNLVMSSDAQQYQQAAREWILANLRQESGAAIGVQEATNQTRTFFPQPGDSPAVIEQKARARDDLQRGLARSSGPAWRSSLTAIPPADSIGMLPRTELLALGNSYHRMNDAQRRAFETAIRAISGAPAP